MDTMVNQAAGTTVPVRRGPLRWYYETVPGLCRSVVLTGLTGAIPAVAGVTFFFGFRFALSWSQALTGPLAVRLLANAGELLMGLVWTAIAGRLAVILGGRPLCQAARRVASSWLGVPINVSYRPLPPVSQMATGHWFNGYNYHQSAWQARRQAWVFSRIRDPQALRDVLWFIAATVAVLPVACLPLLGLGAGTYLSLQPGSAAYGIAMIVAGLAAAPFAWRTFGPVARRFLGPGSGARIAQLEAIRTDMTQTQAAELERIERGLHDGAQARLVGLGLAMGAAEQLVDTDPEAAKTILAEARASSAAALAELRSLVRGINPPVLAERGLVDAIRALALDAPLDVEVRADVPSRPERPVEASVYFAVAELLANVAKHAHATAATVELGYQRHILTATVTDNGTGGAVAAEGSGLHGIERRMAAFGGLLQIDSRPAARPGPSWRCHARCHSRRPVPAPRRAGPPGRGTRPLRRQGGRHRAGDTGRAAHLAAGCRHRRCPAAAHVL
jgi:signal transduction histidine kinase